MVLILLCVFCLIMIYITSKNQSKSSINKSKNHKYTKTNNCNGCLKQETCKYGYYTYDEFDKRQWALWEKFIALGFDNNIKVDFINRPEEINQYINRYSQQNKFNIEDIEWMEKYLNSEQQNLNRYNAFGKCGKAYARYMKLDYLVKDIKLKLKDIRVSN